MEQQESAADKRELWQLSAVEAVSALREGRVTPLELVEAAEARWKATDGAINAIPVTCWPAAKQRAQEMMAAGPPADPPPAFLYGLPVAVKDITAVAGLPLTFGCTARRDNVARSDDPMVQRLLQHGAIIVGKTNTPEFAAGSQTFNALWGTTRNPFDTSKTVGGSSGGSAAALAAGQVWLATGTDLGGSLRNPASFCGVVGMRNSVGVVPCECDMPREQLQDKRLPHWRLRSVNGLLARSAHDLALGLDAVVGAHPADPTCLPAPATSFSAAVAARLAAGSSSSSKRVAFSPHLGVPPVEPEVEQICRAAAGWWLQQREQQQQQQQQQQPADAGAVLTEAVLDLSDMQEAFLILRAHGSRGMAAQAQADPALRAALKPDLLWQLDLATTITQEQLDAAAEAHDRMLAATQGFFRQHDLLLTPTVWCAPFDAIVEWPRSSGSHVFKTYVCWLKACSLLSALGVPAVSVPCGTTASGLPVGLQIVGPPGADALVLAEAAAFEAAHSHWRRVPP